MQPKPVTIITGFLGAGKTTLLNNIISKHSDKRFAIIENEFGDINIDRELISSNNGSNVYELSNGCICCTLSRELGLTLNGLIMSINDFDHLIIESTGIADPGEIVRTFLSGDRVKRYFKIDSVVCVADSVNMKSQLENNPEFRKQIAISDIVLMNKSDGIEVKDMELLNNEVVIINSQSDIYETSYCNLENIDILGRYSFDSGSVEKQKFIPISGIMSLGSNHKLTSHTFVFDKPFSEESFKLWVRSYMMFNKNSIYRVKGIVCIKESEEKLIVQGVNGDVDFTSGSRWSESETKESKLVVIGNGINRKELEDNLSELMI